MRRSGADVVVRLAPEGLAVEHGRVDDTEGTAGASRASRRPAIVGGIVAAGVIVAALATWWLTAPLRESEAAVAPSPRVTSSASASGASTPSPSATPTGFAVNTVGYDTTVLPSVDVFGIYPALPVDTDPFGATTQWRVRAATAAAPVFADPTGEPVAALPRDYEYGGTTVPVIERQENWVKVLLVGRQAMPSQGNAAQIAGWMRVADVEFSTGDTYVEVSLSARTVDIVRAGVAERIASDFGSGVEATPTPVGRSFIMTTRIEPSFGYTRGNPISYLSVQSSTLDGFAGADVAITAFHYHDARSGTISNGCIRVRAEATQALAALPDGTPVYVRA